jgi:hypothetical protein
MKSPTATRCRQNSCAPSSCGSERWQLGAEHGLARRTSARPAAGTNFTPASLARGCGPYTEDHRGGARSVAFRDRAFSPVRQTGSGLTSEAIRRAMSDAERPSPKTTRSASEWFCTEPIHSSRKSWPSRLQSVPLSRSHQSGPPTGGAAPRTPTRGRAAPARSSSRPRSGCGPHRARAPRWESP